MNLKFLHFQLAHSLQLNPVEASIVQPTPEELRKKQLANQLFGMGSLGGGGGLSGPSRAPRHKQRKGNLGKVDRAPQQPKITAGAQSEENTTDLLLDLQVCLFSVWFHVHVHVSWF